MFAVMHGISSQAFFLSSMTKLEVFASIIAAAIHDMRHPGRVGVGVWFVCVCGGGGGAGGGGHGAGASCATTDMCATGVNNSFLVATGAELALQYNDTAVLENMHVAEFFKLARRDAYENACLTARHLPATGHASLPPSRCCCCCRGACRNNVFAGLERGERQIARRMIIDMVRLACTAATCRHALGGLAVTVAVAVPAPVVVAGARN
jgi:hypothetical protein